MAHYNLFQNLGKVPLSASPPTNKGNCWRRTRIGEGIRTLFTHQCLVGVPNYRRASTPPRLYACPMGYD